MNVYDSYSDRTISRPMFSLLHATRRLPFGWIPAFHSWIDRADSRLSIEYVLCTESPSWNYNFMEPVKFVVNTGRACCVDAYNTAARASTGHVLVAIADDLFPPAHWDTQVLTALGHDPTREAAVWLTTEHTHIMTNPCLTRAYYERPDRGGCGGDLFHPAYASYGADDDFTEVARRDEAIVKPSPPIVCEHVHWTRGMAEMDATYAHTAGLGAGKEKILAKRRAEGFK